MSKLKKMNRRALILGAGGAAAGGLIGMNWRTLSRSEGYEPLLNLGDDFNRHAQRLVMWGRPLAPEFRRDQISNYHPISGGFGALFIDKDPEFDKMLINRFRDWRLKISGLVRNPMSLTLDEIRRMPSRTQITMHCCDAGWSAIGQWTGVPLGWLLSKVDLMPGARYIIFHAMDKIGGQLIFESLDLIDAVHPQTILAYDFNGGTLPAGHGAPLRLRIELQLGYKNLKHLQSIQVVDSLDNFAHGRGGLYQLMGFQRYAGL